jgi:transposase
MGSITLVGIDASKDQLDVLIDRPQRRRHVFSNDQAGIDRLKKELGPGEYLIAIEASGRYEAFARHELEAAGYTVKLQNPRQVRRLAEGLGVQAKTDGIDAEILARTAPLCAPNEPRTKERQDLTDVSRAIECLKRERSAHLARMQTPGLVAVVVKALRRVVASIERQIQNLEAEFVRMVKASSLAERYELALTVPRVGPNLARIAVCELPQRLEQWSIRQLSSYAGIAPLDDQSGKKNGPAKLPKDKNPHLKAALYMPAMGLVMRHPWAKTTYRRLRSRGLVHQQAIVPIMHKLLFHLVAVMKRGSAWQAEPQRT